jgi:hypothetical protein
VIYFIYSDQVRKHHNVPEIGSVNVNFKLSNVGFEQKAALAESIFTFNGGKTVYMKNRHDIIPNGYQFTEEERLVIVLKAVPL